MPQLESRLKTYVPLRTSITSRCCSKPCLPDQRIRIQTTAPLSVNGLLKATNQGQPQLERTANEEENGREYTKPATVLNESQGLQDGKRYLE